jgi:hypothetical protein
VVDGKNMVLDPGTYVYTSYPELRNLFRSTEYHNTIKFGDYKQNENSELDLFLLSDRIEIKRTSLKENSNKVLKNYWLFQTSSSSTYNYKTDKAKKFDSFPVFRD